MEAAKKDLLKKREHADKKAAELTNAEHKLTEESSELKEAEEGTKAAEESVKRWKEIREMDEQDVEAEIAEGKEKFQTKMKEVDNKRAKTDEEITSIKKEYSDWQSEQESREKNVESVKAATKGASEAYEKSRKEAFDRGQQKVFKKDSRKAAWKNGAEEGFEEKA